jgi:hypothetical protein
MSQGHNLIGVADGATGLASSDLSGTAAAPLDAKLAVMDDYSGLEPTMPPLVGSPLIDAGDSALASGISTDERGLPRVAGAAVDIGADESQAVPLVVPGDGDLGPGRGLSLRSAVNLAQVAPAAGPITFGPRAIGLVKLARGPLVIRTGSPVIVGPGSFDLTIDGVSTRAITVNTGASLTVLGLTFSGHSTDAGGAVGNFGSLALSDCTLTGGFSPGGGAVFNCGSLSIDNSTLMGNDTPGGGRGGAIYNDVSGVAFLTNDTISGNAAFSGAGGGIYNAGNLSVSMTTFAGNSSSAGGGLYDTGNLPALVTNSTFSANTVAGTNAAGGAVYDDGTLSLVNCTLTGNTAGNGLGGGVLSGGQLKIGNTIIAGNTAGAGPDVSGPIKSLGHNLIGISNGGGGFIASDRSGTASAPLDPKLAPLGDYGGATRTIPPRAGSPAIDAGDNSLAAALATDQRGLARVSGAAVDIGAVEYPQDPLVVNTTVDDGTLAGQLSLRQAINLINAGAVGSNHVRFALDPGAVIQLLPSEPLVITAPAIIEGPGPAALRVGSSGSDASIVIQASPVSISGLFLGGHTALRVDAGGGAELSNVSTGGDFAVFGALTLDGSLQLKGLNIYGGSVRMKDAASPAALDLTGLAIDPRARLDVGDGNVRIHSTATDLPGRIASYLSTGSAQDAWNGPGIDSSAAAANKSYGVGYGDDGAGTLTIRYTLLGDANLDGRVGFADLLALAQHYLQTGTSWPQGDFNYDGSTGFDDLLLVAQNYGKNVTSARRHAQR